MRIVYLCLNRFKSFILVYQSFLENVSSLISDLTRHVATTEAVSRKKAIWYDVDVYFRSCKLAICVDCTRPFIPWTTDRLYAQGVVTTAKSIFFEWWASRDAGVKFHRSVDIVFPIACDYIDSVTGYRRPL